MEPQPPEPQPPRDRRPDALGDLRVLPDELLCAIIELLSPPDLGRLSCVSSVMYILCNEEPLWMNLCLGVSGQVEYKGSWKKTTLFRNNLGIRNEENSERTLSFDGFNSLFLYRRWYRRFTTLDAFSADTGDLERKKNLTLEEFHSQYDGQKPVLLTELAETWPAKDNWTFDQLSLKYGDVAFGISQKSSKKIKMKFKDYVSYMDVQHDEDPLYIFDDKFGEAAPALLEDYHVPHLFQEDFFDVLDDERPPFRWLIIGPERSGASWHVDPALTSAWNTLLAGRKRWALYPPGRVPIGVTVHVSEEDGDVHVETPSSLQWWLDIYPHLADYDKPLECTQLPGETIFVPSGWWHCILNLEPTIAVTQNFVNTTNFEFVCLDMAPGHRHKGLCRAGLLAVQDNGVESSDTDTLHDKSQFNYFDMTRKEKRLKVFEQSMEPCRQGNNWDVAINGLSDSGEKMQGQDFVYDIEFLAKFLDEERDHYNSTWSPSNCIGPRELRGWLHKLWIVKPTMRQLLWKGACLALNVEKWAACMLEICAHHSLPFPSDDEKFPVGTGSNPVYLISDCVIKIYVEGGLGFSIHGLGTEMEFYSLLHETKSPLIDHVPDVLASGLLIHENGFLRAIQWDGKGIPDVLSKSNFVKGDIPENGFCFGVWNKKQFVLKNSGVDCSTKIWPYLVTKRCKGDIFAKIRDTLLKGDVLHLASFLGDQLRNLHILPLPHFQNGIDFKINKMSLTKEVEGDVMPAVCEGLNIPPPWELVVATLASRKNNIKERLVQWGDPIPDVLIEKVEEYIPHDPVLLLDLFKDNGGLCKVVGSPTWIHSDIMDDNVHMESCNPTLCFHGISFDASSTLNSTLDAAIGDTDLRKCHPTHILDFSDLSVGVPLYDLIPIYLDIFRGDVCLLKQLLDSYRLPLTGRASSPDMVSREQVETQNKKLSYRAMCYCILHEDNVLGAIFSLWKELKAAKSWEEVELAVWGELNNYQCSD